MIETGKVTTMDEVSIVSWILLLMEMHNEVNVTHTYREANRCVDTLAKVGAESGEDVKFGDQIPIFIWHFIVSDVTGSLMG